MDLFFNCMSASYRQNFCQDFGLERLVPISGMAPENALVEICLLMQRCNCQVDALTAQKTKEMSLFHNTYSCASHPMSILEIAIANTILAGNKSDDSCAAS